MNSILIQDWRDHFPGEPSENVIREYFLPTENYRVSRYEYPVGTEFPGSMQAGTIFVIKGSCDYDFGEVVRFTAGHFAELPGGNYSFSVTGEAPVELVIVWKI